MDQHPCMSCGACCNYFKIQFHRYECLSENRLVPEELTYPVINSDKLVMIGTNKKDPRCIALQGVVGQKVKCSIYENRPTCCRDFTASYDEGVPNFRCDQARVAKGMKPLTLKVWDTYYQDEILKKEASNNLLFSRENKIDGAEKT